MMAKPVGVRFRLGIKAKFLAGLLVILPLFITFYFLIFMFQTLDSFLGPFFKRFLGYHIPGLGLVSSILIILLVGILTTNVVGRKLVVFGEELLVRIPLVRGIYSAVKQIVVVFSSSSRGAFRQVVLIEYPRKGLYSIGFVTGKSRGKVKAKATQEVVSVFVPSTPNPTTGFLILVPQKDIIPLAISIEEGIKLVVSGGLLTPAHLLHKRTKGY